MPGMDSNRGDAAPPHFTPTPIPESQAYKWDDLLTPTQQALKELLTWLDSACESSSRSPVDQHLSTSLLVAGARGSGKTTLLLSAALALRDWKRFLGAQGGYLPRGLDPRHDELARLLQHLEGRITWMDPLDLEPLPAKANLLATLLVRVRAAVDGARFSLAKRGAGAWGPSSILEESAEDTWGKLDQLVRDASFMWEDLPSSTDARARAEQQIKASEIYANFQGRFCDAMEQVAGTLSIPQFGPSEREQVILVLPIDNVDRSIEHLYNIVKLVRMVASRRLWFVLAAGQQEFQLFMERAFQKEFLVTGHLGIGLKGRDETLAIARRQAATTLRRALPPSYRIDIGLVQPEESWTYPYRFDEEKRGLSEHDIELHELLRELRLPSSPTRGHSLTSFADLFDLGPRLAPSVVTAYQAAREDGAVDASPGAEADPRERGGAPRPLFTDAARQALTLPARTLRDLWHAAYREWKRSGVDDGERAVRVATEMLRNAIDEAELPAWASEQLHNRILRWDAQGRIVLDLTGKPVGRVRRTSLSHVMEWPRWGTPGAGVPPEGSAHRGILTSELHLRHFHDVFLEQHDLDKPGNRVHMPGNVSGWFMLLHDLLMLFPEPRVLNVEVTPFEISPELVVTLHELFVARSDTEPFVKLDFLWSLPTWDTFVDFAIFTAQWRAFLHEAQHLFTFHPNAERAERLFRLVLAAWLDNVCAVAGLERGRWDLKEGVSKVIASDVRPGELEDYEHQVRAAIGGLLRAIHEGCQGFGRLWMARVWLEQSLPLLTLPEFAPSPRLSHLLSWREKEVPDMRDWEELLAYWEHHLHRLTRNRQNVVRSVVMRSGAYASLRASQGSDRSTTAWALEEWLARVTRAWFSAVDGDRRKHELEVLQELAPDALNGHVEAEEVMPS